MSTFCTCPIDVISKAGFSMRDGIAYCNSCSKPEVNSTSVKVAPKQNTGSPIADLFDFKFERFVSVSYFRLLYGVSVILWTIVAILFIFLLFADAFYVGGGLKFLLFIGIIVFYFVMLVYTRISIEVLVNFFQIGKDIKTLRESS